MAGRLYTRYQNYQKDMHDRFKAGAFATQYVKAKAEADAKPSGKYSILRRQKSDSGYETENSYDEDFRR